MKQEKVFVGAQVPPQMKTEIMKALETGRFLNESDFIRQAIRNLLDETTEAK